MSEQSEIELAFMENLYRRFARLAYANLNKMLETTERLTDLRPEINHHVYFKLRREQKDSGFIAIVFSAMALEGYLNDYGARNFGYSFAKKHLDRLSIENKLIIIPQLVTGKSYPKDRLAYQQMKDLVSDRHWLVHYKPKKISMSPKNIPQEIKSSPPSLEKRAISAIRTLELIAVEIEELDPKEDARIQIAPWMKSNEG